MISKKFLRVLIIVLGLLIALPIWQLSGMVLWGILCGVTTILVLDIAMLRPYSRRMKLICLAFYVISMICVVTWVLTME